MWMMELPPMSILYLMYIYDASIVDYGYLQRKESDWAQLSITRIVYSQSTIAVTLTYCRTIQFNACIMTMLMLKLYLQHTAYPLGVEALGSSTE
jgi:hypothetical protein